MYFEWNRAFRCPMLDIGNVSFFLFIYTKFDSYLSVNGGKAVTNISSLQFFQNCSAVIKK